MLAAALILLLRNSPIEPMFGPPLVAPTTDSIKKWVVAHGVLDFSCGDCTFRSAGTFTCVCGADGSGKENGRWQIEGNTVVVGFKSEPKRVEVTAISKELLVYREKGREQAVLCSDIGGGDVRCPNISRPIVGAYRAGIDESSFSLALQSLPLTTGFMQEGWDGVRVCDVGKASRRDVSEIRYRDGFAKDAMDFAVALVESIGSVQSVPGETGLYDVVIVLAKTPPTSLRVKVVDGHCVSGPPCTNARVAALTEKVNHGAWEVRAGGPAKKARSTTELWFAPGKEALALRIAKELAGELKGPPQLWTWPADFDVLVIAGPP